MMLKCFCFNWNVWTTSGWIAIKICRPTDVHSAEWTYIVLHIMVRCYGRVMVLIALGLNLHCRLCHNLCVPQKPQVGWTEKWETVPVNLSMWLWLCIVGVLTLNRVQFMDYGVSCASLKKDCEECFRRVQRKSLGASGNLRKVLGQSLHRRHRQKVSLSCDFVYRCFGT